MHSAAAQTPTADRIVVEADRLPDADSSAPFDLTILTREELRRAPQLRLDDILRAEVPGFSLFRRSSSRTANPTTQGITLRNFGPSGAGRTLVLLDGIPLNDPFAGYVLWSQVPPASIDSALVIPGGGAGLFGNAALAGTIFLISKPMTQNGAYADASIGNENTYEAAAGGTLVHGPIATAVFAERFSTSGYPVLQANQRGPVDNNASADSEFFDLRSQWQIARNSSLAVEARHFEDDRGNGTTLTENDTTGNDFSALWTTDLPAQSSELRLSAYGQRRKFRSTFSSINATRDVETLALDQFNVPANAIGGSAVWSMALRDAHRLTAGADLRWVEGETDEHFLWNGSAFTRLREAGGRQLFVGAFAEDTWLPNERLTIVGGVRYDRWQLYDGFRQESDRATRVVSLDSDFADREGDEINGRVGIRFAVTSNLSVRGAAYTGFRVPTLNELYRPFRVGNDVTEANPALQPEHSLGGETGIDWQATESLRIAGTAFVNRLQDAVGNVTIGEGPGTFNPGGFIPEGGVLRQRQNIDLVVAPGFEASVAWQVHPSLRLRGSYVFTRPRVEQAADRALEGKLLAQTPENIFTGSIDWRPAAKWLVTAQARYVDRQFEDDQNSRVLAPFTTFDGAISYGFSAHLTAAIRIENLFNAEIENGKSAGDLVSIGGPRLISFGLQWQL
ncbi:MAG TPA: TonB-dependent receptor [Chthoniobacterales bacterium]|jgi:outer membrane receptor protein involved in Fe transport|nr:TonB-dependent receptor [Chthoniobacterales bacterium]